MRAAETSGRHETVALLVHKEGHECPAKILFRAIPDSTGKLAGFGILAHGLSTSMTINAGVGAAGRVAKILLVDDDAPIRREAAEHLRSLGHIVLEASGGDEALGTLQVVADVDLLLTDVVMPGGIGGRSLAQQAILERPSLKVLFASGYFHGALVERGEIAAGDRLLVKPFRKSDLTSRVREILDTRA